MSSPLHIDALDGVTVVKTRSGRFGAEDAVRAAATLLGE